MAGNYTAIVLVGSFLLGVAIRGLKCPRPWQPIVAAVVLAIGTGYRTDIGLFWLPVFLIILTQHGWRSSALAVILFAILNLTWIGAMLHDAGGWANYRASVAEFGYQAGTLNSVWNLGLLDGTVRYAVKIGMALVWTLGPALVFVPRGVSRLGRLEDGGFLTFLIGISALPALGFHLLIHFGVPGYGFHYLPALMGLVAVGIGRYPTVERPADASRITAGWFLGDRAVPRLIGSAALMAAAFWFYPTDVSPSGWRGDFDLAFCRFTRHGLSAPIRRVPTHWRTANSRDLAGNLFSVPQSVIGERDRPISSEPKGPHPTENPPMAISNDRRTPSSRASASVLE